MSIQLGMPVGKQDRMMGKGRPASSPRTCADPLPQTCGVQEEDCPSPEDLIADHRRQTPLSRGAGRGLPGLRVRGHDRVIVRGVWRRRRGAARRPSGPRSKRCDWMYFPWAEE